MFIVINLVTLIIVITTGITVVMVGSKCETVNSN